MMRLVLHRLVWGVGVLWVVATLTFLMLRVVPGGPFDQEKILPPEIKRNIEAKYLLDQPVHVQYLSYLKGAARGDFGPSYKYAGREVTDILRDTFPVSLELGLWALLLTVLIGVAAGLLSAARPRTVCDHAGVVLTTVGISVPAFVLGTVLILVFAHRLKSFPPALWEGWRHVMLPAVTLSLLPASYIARLTRSGLLESLGQEYIRTARSKGLGETAILLSHALKNSLSPVLSFMGPLTAALITGSFVVEYLFAVPGMGRFFITAVTNRDYPLIMGVTLLYGVLIILANLVVDLAYGYLDPRVRMETRK